MRRHLHADDVGPWPAARVAENAPPDLPPFRVRPPWLVFLAKHLAPRNHERYLLQGSEISQEVWDRAFPPLTPEERARLETIGVRFGMDAPLDFQPVRLRPRWLAFLYRIGLFRDDDDEDE